MPSVTLRTPTEQAPAEAVPPRRTIAVVAVERPDWSWRFDPAVPDAVRPRLAELAAAMADARGLRDELEGYPVWARDLEWDLHAVAQEREIAAAFDGALELGYALRVVPAVGRPRERGGEA